MCVVDNAGSSKYRFSPNTSVVGRLALLLFPQRRLTKVRDLVGLDPSFRRGKDWLYAHALFSPWISSGTNEVGTIDRQIMQRNRLMTLSQSHSQYRLLLSLLSKEPITPSKESPGSQKRQRKKTVKTQRRKDAKAQRLKDFKAQRLIRTIIIRSQPPSCLVIRFRFPSSTYSLLPAWCGRVGKRCHLPFRGNETPLDLLLALELRHTWLPGIIIYYAWNLKSSKRICARANSKNSASLSVPSSRPSFQLNVPSTHEPPFSSFPSTIFLSALAPRKPSLLSFTNPFCLRLLCRF